MSGINISSIAKRIPVLFFLIHFSSAFSQITVSDSLQSYIKKDTIRVNLLNAAAAKILSNDIGKALQLLKESEQLSETLHYRKGKAYSMLYTGKAQINKGEFYASLNTIDASLAVYEELKDKEGIATCYLNSGRAYYYMSDFPKATESFKHAIAVSEEAGKPKIQSNALMIIGMMYNAQGDNVKSLEYYRRALAIDERLANKKGISATLINIANLYKQQAAFTLALESYNKALEIRKQLGDEFGVATIYNNLGTMYQEMEDNKAALPYYKKALPIIEKLQRPKDLIGCLSNIGIILMDDKNPKALKIFEKALGLSKASGDTENVALSTNNIAAFHSMVGHDAEAIQYYEKAVKMHQQLGLQRELSNDYLNIGRSYYAIKDFENALKSATAGNKIAKQLKLLSLQTDFSLLLSKIYYSIKEYKLAYENGQDHKELHDSLYKKEDIDKLAQIKYKYAYKDTLNTAKKKVKALNTKLIMTQAQKKWLLVGFAGLLVILAFVTALLKIRKVKMKNQQLLLEQKLLITQMNPHFIFNSIQNIQGLIYDDKDDEAVDYLDKFSALTRQILENSTQNYISLSDEIEMSKNYLVIQQLLYSNKFDFTIAIDDAIDADSVFLPPMLTQPFIENAIKHGLSNRQQNGLIDIHFHLKENKLFFEISDNGKGFDFEEKATNHKSLAMTITKDRLINYTKNQDFVVRTDNIIDKDTNVVGAKVSFEIPYIYEN